MSRTRCATCTLCEAACGVLLETDDDPNDPKILSLRGDPDDPMSRGYICPKVVGMKALHEDPDRLRAPVVRELSSTGEPRFVEVSWDEALDRAATGLRAVRARYGDDSLAIYQGNPSAHNLGLLTHGQVVLRTLGTRNVYSASSADQVPHMLAADLMFGSSVLMPVPDVDRTDFFLVIGANPVVSNGSILTAPDMKRRVRAIVERGGEVVVVDPRRTETAELATEHVFIRPNTDPLLLAAMLHVIFSEGLARPERLGAACDGWTELAALVARCPPERAAQETRIPADTIRDLARRFARAERAAAYGRVGLCHQQHGTVGSWWLYALAAVTGNLDREGGSMFTSPAAELTPLVRLLGFDGHGRFESRVRGLREVARELPIATLADEIEAAGEGQVRALLTSAGNPVLSSPNGARLERALEKLDFMVSIDAYVNETTRHAHVILPPVSPLQRDHYDLALNAFAVRNSAKFVAAPLPKSPTEKQDWEIILELGVRLRLGRGTASRALRALVVRLGRELTPARAVDLLIRMGPRGAGLLGRRPGLTLERIAREPHGVDLGPLEPRLAAVLKTPQRRVALHPPLLTREAHEMFDALASRAPRPNDELLLIGRRHLRSNNSWLHNAPPLVKGPDRCVLLVHPVDAGRVGVVTGDRVRVRSRVGELAVPVEVSDEVMQGVVSLPHGFGHRRRGDSAPPARLSVAERHAGASLNDLTDDSLVDRASGNAAFSGVSVLVEKLPATVTL
ncbi:MAG: molybdopterin-dependent oxidoreductase [Polyangiaceae bacterium]